LLFGAGFVACGTDVDLGGTPAVITPDAEVPPEDPVELCEPCANARNCPLGSACARLSGNNEFCATLCPRGTECDRDDTCTLVASVLDGESFSACAPKGGACAPAAMPTVVDGATLDHCGLLVGPPVPADCRSCESGDGDCQPNGCYAGWWCDRSRRPGRCRKPPTTCP